MPADNIKEKQQDFDKFTIDSHNFNRASNRNYQISKIEHQPIFDFDLEDFFDEKDDLIENDIRVKCELLDVNISQKENLIKLYDSLSGIEKYESLFKIKSIQVLIDYQFGLLKSKIIWQLLFPYILQLAGFIAFSNSFNENISDDR